MRLLLAVDGAPCSEAAVQAVIDRFRPEDTEVKIVHAVEWFKEMPLCFQFAQGPSAGQDITECRNRSFDRARQLIEKVSAGLTSKGFRVSAETLDADPRHAIIDAATQWPADIIMMGSHGRRGFNRLLLGSVAESVLRHAPCSVEIVRPAAAA